MKDKPKAKYRYPGWGIFTTKSEGWIWLHIYPVPTIGISFPLDKLEENKALSDYELRTIEYLEKEARNLTE